MVVLCPGSRSGEIKRHLPVIVAAAKIIRTQIPQCRFTCLRSRSADASLFTSLPSWIQIEPNEELPDVFQNASAGILVSGTVTLEAAAYGLPMVITYRMNALNFWLAKKLIKTEFIGLPNIVCQYPIAKELIQHQATAEKLAAAVTELLQDPLARNKMQAIQQFLPQSNNEPLVPVIQSLLTEGARSTC